MNTGHVKQVAAFEKLLGYCNAHGAMYNPGKASLKVAALNTLLTSAQQSLEAVKTLRTAYDNAVNTRNQAFADLPKFMTRIVNTLASTDASGATVEEAYFFCRKFRPSPKTRMAIPAGNPGTVSEIPLTRSTSQLDFDSKADNFAAFVKVIAAEPSYKPNEVELQIVSLNALVTSLRDKNKAVLNAQIALSNARAARNRVLYAKTGIHGSALAVKCYVKGLFGFQSVGYQQIRGLKFINENMK
jgi:hypothetical protein